MWGALRNLWVCDVTNSFQSTYKMCPDVSSVITLLTLELEETQTFFHLVISKNPEESLFSYCLNASFSFSFQVSNVGEDNLRKQTIFLTCSWRLWASACWSSCSSLSLSISYCCSQSTSPWEPSGVLFSLFSSKSLVISVKLAGPEESQSTVYTSLGLLFVTS